MRFKKKKIDGHISHFVILAENIFIKTDQKRSKIVINETFESKLRNWK